MSLELELKNARAYPELTMLALEVFEDECPDLENTATNQGEKAAKRHSFKLVGKIASFLGLALVALALILMLAVVVGPRIFPYQSYGVLSGSMVPNLPVGSMVFVTQVDASDLKVGDVITVNNPTRPGTLVTHRIVELKNTGNGKAIITKGDANGNPDPWFVNATGKGWRMAFNVPYLGYIVGFICDPMFRWWVTIFSGAVLGIIFMIEIWKPKKSSKAITAKVMG